MVERPGDRSPEPPQPGLTVAALACSRGGRRIVADVSFHAAPGALLALRGPNGCGKSTLLRALAGLLRVDRGDATLASAPASSPAPVSLSADRDGFQERLAYAGHLDAVKPNFTVAENLAFWAAFSPDPSAARARIGEALAAFSLETIADAPAGYCSAGQKRRLGLARLALTPKSLWLLDEPTVSLDAAAEAQFGALLRAHLDAGGVAVAATHTPLPVEEATVFALSGRRPGPSAPAEATGAVDAEPALEDPRFADPFLDPRLEEPHLPPPHTAAGAARDG